MAEQSKRIFSGLDQSAVLLSQAQNGDRDAARQLLKHAARHIAEGTPLSEETATWLSKALMSIANGEQANSVFYLTKRRGRRQANSEEFQRLVAESIHYSKDGRHKAANVEGELCGAYSKAAEFFGISENTAERYYQAQIQRILADWDVDHALRDERD